MVSQLDSWHPLTLKSSESIALLLDKLVIEVADYFDTLTSMGLMNLWHYRYGSEWVSFRIRASNGNSEKLSRELEKIGTNLESKYSKLKSSNEHLKWYSEWNSVIEAHESEEKWNLWMETLYHLSKVTENLMRADMSFWKGVHQYFNMIGWQDMGAVYSFNPKSHNEFKIALGESEYQVLLDYATKLYRNYATKVLEQVPIFAALLLPRTRQEGDNLFFYPILKRSDCIEED